MNETLPRINVYVCECGCHTVTVDVDHGVTPFLIQCRSRSRPDRPIDPGYLDDDGFCRGEARSCMYPTGPMPNYIRHPEWEWYKPDNTDGMSKSEIDYWRKGGLSLRPRTEKQPILHGEKNG